MSCGRWKVFITTAFCKNSVLNTANREAVILIVVVHVGFLVVAVNVKFPSVIIIVGSGRPKVAVVAFVVEITGFVPVTAENSRT